MDAEKRLEKIMKFIDGRVNAKQSDETITELFDLYRIIFNRDPGSKSCSSCRAKVYRSLKQYSGK